MTAKSKYFNAMVLEDVTLRSEGTLKAKENKRVHHGTDRKIPYAREREAQTQAGIL